RPARARVIRRVLREPAGRGLFLLQIDEPQVRGALVGFEVGFAQREGDVAPVGRHLRIGKALQAHEIRGSERLRGGLCGERASGDQRRQRKNETAGKEHRGAPGKRGRALFHWKKSSRRFFDTALAFSVSGTARLVALNPLRTSRESRVPAAR